MDSPNRKKFIIAAIVAIVLIAGGIYLVNIISYDKTHEETDNAVIEGDVVPIIPRTSGYITKIYISDNQTLKKGDTLFLIDDRELKVKLNQAKAALENAKANLTSTQSLVATGEANYSVSLANAAAAKDNIAIAKARLWKVQQDFERYSALVARKSITQQQFESTKTDKETNETQLAANEKQLQAANNQAAAAKAQINNYERQVGVAQSVLAQRIEDLNFAQLQLTYSVVTAPEDGFIYKRTIQPGQYVTPGAQLFYLISSGKMWVVANFKETQINNLRIGQKAEISIDALGNNKVSGMIESFSKSTGSRLTLLPPDNATGNFVKVVQRIPVKISFGDTTSKALMSRLSVGMNVIVNVNTGK